MKTKQLLSTLLFLCAVTFSFAQVSFTQSGIAVQGIARDKDNAVRALEPVVFKFTLYYKGGESDPIVTDELTLTTDQFGVFSHVIKNPNTSINNHKFSNNQMWLRVEGGGEVISDEALQYVPYAISANNGVPTGSIMPFVGKREDVPAGWALCDGGSLPAEAVKLKAMIGDFSPNLGGMFLRGAGENTNKEPEMDFTDNDGPRLNEIQDDKYLNHDHRASSTNAGGHTPSTDVPRSWDSAGGAKQYGIFYDKGAGTSTFSGESVPDHKHTITVNSSTTGGTETRPVNYGVNYIIKL